MVAREATFFSAVSRMSTPWKNMENFEFSGNFFVPGEIREFSYGILLRLREFKKKKNSLFINFGLIL